MAGMGPPKDGWDSVQGGNGHPKMLLRATGGQQVQIQKCVAWATGGQQVGAVSDTISMCCPSVALKKTLSLLTSVA